MATEFTVDTVDIGTQPWGQYYTRAACAISDTLFAVSQGLHLFTYDYITKTATLRRDNTGTGYYALRYVNGKLYGIKRDTGSIGAWYIERINMDTWSVDDSITLLSAGYEVTKNGAFIWYDDNHILIQYAYISGNTPLCASVVSELTYTNGVITGVSGNWVSRTYISGIQFDNLVEYNGRFYYAHSTYKGTSSFTEYRSNIYSSPEASGGSRQTHVATGGTNNDVVKLLSLSETEALFFLNKKIYIYDFPSNTLTDTGKELPVISPETVQMVKTSTGYVFLFQSTETTISTRTFNIKYKIANNSGSNTYVELNNAPPITGVTFSRSGYDVSYTFTTDYESLTGTYESTPPEGKIVVGYALRPNATEPLFEINTSISLYREEDTTFYEVYSRYKPPATTFNINVYENTAEPNRVDKSSYLSTVTTLSGALREQTSIVNPSIIIQRTSLPRFNYVYIPEFHRYYFVVNITAVRMKLWQIDLKCDPLMTYKTGIGALNAVVGRQENISNPDLTDTELPLEKENAITVQEITSNAFSTSSTGQVYNYVLTVVGA